MTIEEIKNKPSITREDIANLLKTIGEPGEKQAEKMAVIKELEKTNFQGIDVGASLNSYQEF